jgi:DNA-directed RNA polymerase subunit RPC12/RpoP
MELTCLYCGREFSPQHGAQKKYCCRECGNKAHDHNKIMKGKAGKEVGTCLYCGAQFDRSGWVGKKYCCEEHRELYHRRNNTAKHTEIAKAIYDERVKPRECAWCGKTFKPPFKGPHNYKTCSSRCSDALSHFNRKYFTREKALRYGGTNYDAYYKLRHSIFKRDGYVCYLCGKSIDMSLKNPHPMSASIDHVIALANGGNSEPDNLRATHLRCNMNKRDRKVFECANGQIRFAL